MLHSYLQGSTLLETIHLNLLNQEEASELGPKGWGKPGWELPVKTAGDKEAIANATRSYLGRLVPLSRSIRLDAEGRQMILANGLDYPLAPIFREPAATMVQRDEETSVLGVALGQPMLQVRRVALGLGGQPVEWRISTVATAQHDYVNLLSRPA